MTLPGPVVLCIASGAVLVWPGCSRRGSDGNRAESGPESSQPESCIGGCDPEMLSPYIQVAQGSAPIAAIEILNQQAPDGGSAGGCAVQTWSGPHSSTFAGGGPVDVERICPAPAQDVGWVSETCAARYPCMPSGKQLDGGASCTSVSVRISAPFGSSSTCAITVISATGERQTFEATGRWSSSSYHCRTGLGDCIEITPFSAYPSQVTVAFVPAAGEPSARDGGDAVDGT